MRLLQFSFTPQGNLNYYCLTEDFADNAIPPYVILSHRWEKNAEVSYEDMEHYQSSGFKSIKSGWKKLDFLAYGAFAKRHQYGWIDTCCIKQSDQEELNRSIASMFRWYSKAAVCLVYLSDVSSFTLPPHVEQQFSRSQWFKRGWTLQELLAPKCVEFYSREGKYIGNKTQLAQQISQATLIPMGYLFVFSPGDVPWRVVSWMGVRDTEFDEDKAYCLMGLCDVSMPVIRGEGWDKAFKRLRTEIEENEKRISASSDNLCYFVYGEAFRNGLIAHFQEVNMWPCCLNCGNKTHELAMCPLPCSRCRRNAVQLNLAQDILTLRI
jgi:hypothetical protein